MHRLLFPLAPAIALATGGIARPHAPRAYAASDGNAPEASTRSAELVGAGACGLSGT